MAFTRAQVEPVLKLIGKHESKGGDYDIVWGGLTSKYLPPRKITTMTVAEVMAWQDDIVRRGAKSSAAGFYQIIRKTLRAIVTGAKINTSRKFDAATQDEMAMYLLRGRDMQSFLDGKIVMSQMVLNLSKEWASLPVPYRVKGGSRMVDGGQSYYAGDGLNKAGATIGEVNVALEMARDIYQGRVQPVPEVSRPAAPEPATGNWLTGFFAALAAIFGGRK